MARRGVSSFLPTILSFVSILLVIFVLVPGLHNGLTQVYYLKTTTKDFQAGSKLSGSSFLEDLSTISGADYVGTASAASLGLGDFYTIHLLTSCAHFANGDVDCASPSRDFSFDPLTDLRLDSTALYGNYSQDLLDSLSQYSTASRFLVPGYAVGIVLLFLGTLSDWFSYRSVAAGVVASITGLVSAILFFAASIVSLVVFRRVNDAFNAELNSHGMFSSLGYIPIALSFFACLLALASASCFVVHARGARSSGPNFPFGGASYSKPRGAITGGDPSESAPFGQQGAGPGMGGSGPSQGLWGRIPTFNRHTYVQVEKQPALGRNTPVGQRGAVIYDQDQHHERSRSHSPDPHSNIPMMTLGSNGRSMNQNTAYEPFKTGMAL